MIKLSEQQRGERWDALPETLRDALVSDANFDFIAKTCKAQLLPEQKTNDVIGITGYVLSGFLRPEDMANEVVDVLQIDRRTADTISSSINRQIFVPLRPEIDKVFGPASKLVMPKTMGVGAPVILSTAPQMPVAMPRPMATPKPVTPTLVPMAQTPKPMATMPIVPVTPAAPTPKPLSDKGWSTMKLSDIAPKPMATPTQPMPAKPAMGMPMPPKPAAMPSMMMQRADVPQPIKNAPDFRVMNINTENNTMSQISGTAPTKPIVLEMGGVINPPKAQPTAAPAQGGAKVVHYGDLKSPLPTQLPTAETGRHVVEMTGTNPIPQVPKPITTQDVAPNAITAKPGMMSVPVPRPPMPKQGAMPVPLPPTPPKQVNAATTQQPAGKKPNVVNF